MAFKDYHKKRRSEPRRRPLPEEVVDGEYESERPLQTEQSASSSPPPREPMTRMIRLQGAIELAGPTLFLVGFFGDSLSLLSVGGIIMAADDILEILLGVLNPIFPVLFAFILAFVFDPWYLGVFWSLAVFKIFNLRVAWMKLVSPERLGIGS